MQNQSSDEPVEASKAGPSCAARGALPKLALSSERQSLPKPKCCESRQPYGSVRDSVWELELGLGLQAKAKAATKALRWRVP